MCNMVIFPTRYDAQLEEMLDEAYERYVTKKGGEVKQERKRAKRVNTDADEELLEVISDTWILSQSNDNCIFRSLCMQLG